MNSNTVLGKIMTLLSLTSEEEVKLAFAKLADGTLLESPTFDVGESVEVVSEDGTKSPAPDGEHELELTGAEGETVRFKIFVEGGVITERENVELEEEKEEELQAETIEVEPLPNTTDEDDANKVAEFSEEGEEEMEEEVTEEEESEVTINLEDVAKKVEEMAYRIEELEKKLEEAQEEEIIEEEMEEEEMEDVEDKKLDGAPVEMSRVTNSPKHISKNYHNSVLSRMYRK